MNMRKSKKSRTSLAQRLPWSVSAGIAIIATATLFGLANKLEAGGYFEALRYLPRGAISQLLRVLAGLAALSGAIAAISSLSAACRRARLLDGQSDLASVKRLSWQDFERLVGEAYRREGFHVEEVGLGGADGGVDLILRRRGESTLVQCKRWNVSAVGASVSTRDVRLDDAPWCPARESGLREWFHEGREAIRDCQADRTRRGRRAYDPHQVGSTRPKRACPDVLLRIADDKEAQRGISLLRMLPLSNLPRDKGSILILHRRSGEPFREQPRQSPHSFFFTPLDNNEDF
jgi:hypothetical protein